MIVVLRTKYFPNQTGGVGGTDVFYMVDGVRYYARVPYPTDPKNALAWLKRLPR